MRIKSLTLHGFKSFADRTRLELHDGITAIVGPNGCGKSNISDALRWVLGEQRPTAIRGSRMEEAIFGGTEQRRPIHRAEVTLEMSNEDGALPVPYSEVSIGRTVYRGGESEYTLNGAPCRLRDILDLCRDTGLGANAYAIIEGRMVDAILSDRAEERRALFEEAAEIGRYKDRRRVATRRLEQAEADLVRLEDVLSEVQSKVRSLAQQRGRAERHQRLRERLLQLEVAAADARLERTAARLEEARGELEGLTRTRPSEEADLQTAETEAETLRIRLAELERERSGVARAAEEARRAVEECERARLVARERAAGASDRLAALEGETRHTEVRREGLAGSLAAARNAVAEVESGHADVVSREAALRDATEVAHTAADEARIARERARERLERARRELDRFETELRATEDRVRERSEELDRRRPALDSIEAQTRSLTETIESAEGAERRAAARVTELEEVLSEARAATERAEVELRDGRERAAGLEGELSAARARASSLAAIISSSALLPDVVVDLIEDRDAVGGIAGVLSEFLDVPGEWAGAVESHLGPYLHGVVVDDWVAVTRIQGWLADRKAEDGVLVLPLDPGPRVPDGGGEAGLLDRVSARGAGAPWVEALLAGVGAAEGIEPREGPWVGRAGDRQDRLGAVFLGRPGGGDGVLSRRAGLEVLRGEVETLESDLARVRGELEEREARVRETRDRTERLDAETRETEAERRAAAADRASAAARLERLGDERADVSGRIEQLEAFHESALERTETGAERRRELERAHVAAETALAEAGARADEAREADEARRAELHEAQLALARSEASLKSRTEVVDRIEEALRDAESRALSLAEEREQLETVLADSERISTEAEETIAAGLEERGDRDRRLAELETRIDTHREELERRETELRDARRAEREHTERRHALELEVTQLEGARASVQERLEAEWDATLDVLRERTMPPEEGDLEAWETELDGVRRAIARIGPVNLLAQQEYDEETGRLEFLTGQRDDLVGARDDLRASIRRINRNAAEAFMSTFEQVRENFHRTFHSLFEGGECDVWLDDPDDPLDSPIEISASPRGKKTQRIHLLSGGERALTALALLFAIYLAKPSPFCLLDEVDAPLDETNVLRFVHMLAEFKGDTQFIVITHNPRTMEGADWIYGVTMQEPGVSSIVGVEFDQATQVA